MKKILIIEDDTLISELQKDYLEASDFEVTTETDGKKGLNLALNNTFDLVLVDVMLPSANGFEICKELRKHKKIPIIMVTAKKEDIDKVRGLSIGATDYVVKPFSPSELVARVKAHISTYESLTASNEDTQEKVINIKNLYIHPSSRRVYLHDEEIILTNKEYELLLFLASSPNRVFTKDHLFDRIWGMDAIGDVATVTVHINRLRDKIEADSSSPEYIETVWGAGYRFALA